VSENQAEFPIATMCRILGVASRAHYPIKLPLVRMPRDLANFAALIAVVFLTAALLVAVW
jgi:hypothetical protein